MSDFLFFRYLKSITNFDSVSVIFLRYTLQASTFQMAVLLQYNVAESWTVAQLTEHTQIKMDYLIQVLQILLKAKLLTSEDDENELNSNSIISLFTAYKK